MERSTKQLAPAQSVMSLAYPEKLLPLVMALGSTLGTVKGTRSTQGQRGKAVQGSTASGRSMSLTVIPLIPWQQFRLFPGKTLLGMRLLSHIHILWRRSDYFFQLDY